MISRARGSRRRNCARLRLLSRRVSPEPNRRQAHLHETTTRDANTDLDDGGCSRERGGLQRRRGGQGRRRARDRRGARRSSSRRRRSPRSLGAMGTVAARPGHVATLSAPAPGRIAKVNVATGQAVQADQVLVELDQAPFEAAVQSADAAYTAAQQVASAIGAAGDRRDRRQERSGAGRGGRGKTHADVVAARRAATAVGAARTDRRRRDANDRHARRVGRSVAAAWWRSLIPGWWTCCWASRRAKRHVCTRARRSSLTSGQSSGGESLGVGTVADLSSTIDTATRSVTVRVQAPTTRRPLRIGETVFGAIAVSVASVGDRGAARGARAGGRRVSRLRRRRERRRARTRSEGRRQDEHHAPRSLEGLKAGERIVTMGAYGVQDSSKVVPPTAEGRHARRAKRRRSDSAAKPKKP